MSIFGEWKKLTKWENFLFEKLTFILSSNSRLINLNRRTTLYHPTKTGYLWFILWRTTKIWTLSSTTKIQRSFNTELSTSLSLSLVLPRHSPWLTEFPMNCRRIVPDMCDNRGCRPNGPTKRIMGSCSLRWASRIQERFGNWRLD